MERSPWLDGASVTDEPIAQRWTVANATTHDPLEVVMRVEGINPRKTVLVSVAHDTLMYLHPHRQYTRICVEPEYMLHTDRIWADPSIQVDTINMIPLCVGLEVDLEPIQFLPGASTIYYTSIPTLEALYEFLEIHPTLSIAIVGHDQTRGSQDDAAYESRERARAVWEYLITRGIALDRIEIEGRGSSQLRFTEPQTLEEAEANRRVTIRVTNY